MFEIWRRNILENLELVQEDSGPMVVAVVSGSESDKEYWQKHFAHTSLDVFRADGQVSTISVCEKERKGNFLGTLNAWKEVKQSIRKDELPNVALMSMVFGKGKRLSPFTQTLGNRKSAFPTPLRAPRAGTYLRTADLSNMYSNIWIRHLSQCGFRGLIVKWGDEAVIPGTLWSPDRNDYRNVDAVRFVWKTKPTENLAREKEWVTIDSQTGLMVFQYARQEIEVLRRRLSELQEGAYEVGVNLGSLAISYDFLNIALEILHDDVLDPHKWADWDPYVWIALCCADEAEWRAEAEYEDRIGKTGIRELEARYPHFFSKIAQVRRALESRSNRAFAVGTLDFGDAFWTDFGLHFALRRSLESLTEDSERGAISRELFRIPHSLDRHGNIIDVDSKVPESAFIRNSVIIDSIILDEKTVICRGLVVGGQHRRLHMPCGGIALFCAADHLEFAGPHGIAFRSIGSKISISAGGRHTTLFLPEGPENMVSEESVLDYSGGNYTQPILGNRLSFEQAGKIMSEVDGRDLEARWLKAWQEWLH